MNPELTTKDCVTCDKRSLNPFCDIPKTGLDFLNSKKQPQQYRKGETIFEAGKFPSGLYCVSSGVIKIENANESGTANSLRLIGEGGAFGYRSLFANEAYQASALAHEDCEICLIPREAIFELCRVYPDVAMKFLARISGELRLAESRIISLSEKSSRSRVLESLLFLDQNFQDHRWTRRDVAEWAGTTPETVMRVMSTLKDDGLISMDSHKTIVHDREALTRLIENNS